MLITELPSGQPGRIFRSPMPFGKYDPEGLVSEAYHDNEVSVIVLLAEDHECKEKARRDLMALYTQDGFTVVHLPIVDFGIPNAQALRLALDAPVREAQSGRHIAIHCSAGIGRTGLCTAFLAEKTAQSAGQGGHRMGETLQRWCGREAAAEGLRHKHHRLACGDIRKWGCSLNLKSSIVMRMARRSL